MWVEVGVILYCVNWDVVVYLVSLVVIFVRGLMLVGLVGFSIVVIMFVKLICGVINCSISMLLLCVVIIWWLFLWYMMKCIMMLLMLCCY